MTVATTPYVSTVPPWFVTALGEIGVREIPGPQSNPRIIEYFKSTSYPIDGVNDEVAWCSAAMNWVMVNSGVKGTGSAAALSWLKWGRAIQQPTIGCIVSLWRDSPASGYGHVGLFVARRLQTLYLLGGNQQNEFCIAPYPLARLNSGGYRMP